jgi:putative PIN family toxin of toxin-antitoxin system
VITATHDANVLASGAIAPSGGTLATIIAAWLADHYDLIASEPIYDELQSALQKPYFAERLNREDRLAYVRHVRSRSRSVEISVAVSGVATHPEDDLVLATAVSGAVDYLVTGDRKLQALGSYRGVRIVSPRQFVDILAEQAAHEP